MRLLTFNIRFGAGGGQPEKQGYNLPITSAKLADLTAAIDSLQPDVAALQEVYNARQAERISRQLGMRFVYGRHPSGYALDFFEWGLALLHRHEVIRTTQHPLTFDPDLRSGRHALIVTLSIENTPVTFINVHLAFENLEGQVAELLSVADGIENPLAILGDFNCSPDDGRLEPLQSRLHDTCRAITSDGAQEAETVGTLLHSSSRFDYVFVDPRHFIVEDVGLPAQIHRRVSDHLAYYADVRLKNTVGKG